MELLEDDFMLLFSKNLYFHQLFITIDLHENIFYKQISTSHSKLIRSWGDLDVMHSLHDFDLGAQ